LRRRAKFAEYWTIHGQLRIFDFQNGGRPPSWISYDVIADHPRFVFHGPNILLKLHVDYFYTLQDIAIFIFGPFGLKLPIHVPFGGVFEGYYPQMNSEILSQPQRDRPWAKARRMSRKPWKSIHGFEVGACSRKIQYNFNQPTKHEKSHNCRNIPPIWGEAPLNGLE